MTNVYTVYSAAKHNIASAFGSAKHIQRLKKVQCSFVEPKVMANHLYGDNYRSYVRIPGYYDPNSHTIFFNKKTLPQTTEKTAYIICYHELVHSLSAHRVIKKAHYQVFQSGVKIEVFSKQGYRCYNRSLNEGMVQYLTTYYTKVPAENYAYAQEVKLIQRLAHDLGHKVVHRAITDGHCRTFQRRFENQYGANTFNRFSALMDKKRYTDAADILNQN